MVLFFAYAQKIYFLKLQLKKKGSHAALERDVTFALFFLEELITLTYKIRFFKLVKRIFLSPALSSPPSLKLNAILLYHTKNVWTLFFI